MDNKEQALEEIYKTVAMKIYEFSDECWSLPSADKRVIDILNTQGYLRACLQDDGELIAALQAMYDHFGVDDEENSLWHPSCIKASNMAAKVLSKHRSKE